MHGKLWSKVGLYFQDAGSDFDEPRFKTFKEIKIIFQKHNWTKLSGEINQPTLDDIRIYGIAT